MGIEGFEEPQSLDSMLKNAAEDHKLELITVSYYATEVSASAPFTVFVHRKIGGPCGIGIEATYEVALQQAIRNLIRKEQNAV